MAEPVLINEGLDPASLEAALASLSPGRYTLRLNLDQPMTDDQMATTRQQFTTAGVPLQSIAQDANILQLVFDLPQGVQGARGIGFWPLLILIGVTGFFGWQILKETSDIFTTIPIWVWAIGAGLVVYLLFWPKKKAVGTAVSTVRRYREPRQVQPPVIVVK